MNISYKFDSSKKTLLINLSGALNFDALKPFTEAYESTPPEGVMNYDLNMDGVSYLDSWFLGMLLVLKDYVHDRANISINNCSTDVLRVLEVSNIKRLFNIQQIA